MWHLPGDKHHPASLTLVLKCVYWDWDCCTNIINKECQCSMWKLEIRKQSSKAWINMNYFFPDVFIKGKYDSLIFIFTQPIHDRAASSIKPRFSLWRPALGVSCQLLTWLKSVDRPRDKIQSQRILSYLDSILEKFGNCPISSQPAK